MKIEELNAATYLFATIGSLTERGGRITKATGNSKIAGLCLARVGDVVSYPDGSEAVIMDGAGYAAVINNRPVALVGSSLSNGDRIVETLQTAMSIVVRQGETIDGLFDPDYVPPPSTDPTFRFAVQGATTARGGVLREATGDFDVSGTCRKAACVGDFVHYADGTRSQIITGVGLPDTPAFRPLAVVGSFLENGDVINDSPDRKNHSIGLVPVRADASIH